MQKKPGQISANTLGLRFMQNAAKSRQEKEGETAKAKVKSQEEWEISPSVRQSWDGGDRTAPGQGTVTYEHSYLPFLFPALSGADAAPVASTSTSGNSETSEDGDSNKQTDIPRMRMRGRRIFGKQGKEEIIEAEAPPPEHSQPPQPTRESLSLRGVRTISSHSRVAATYAPKSKPTPSTKSSAQHSTAPKTSTAQGPPAFMKPQVDVPRAEGGERKRRSANDGGGTQDGQRKKKRKDRDVTF